MIQNFVDGKVGRLLGFLCLPVKAKTEKNTPNLFSPAEPPVPTNKKQRNEKTKKGCRVFE